MLEINRRPLKRISGHRRTRVVLCVGHHAGWNTASAFTEEQNWCYANCDVVALIPDRKDLPSAKGSLWDKDKSKWRIKLVSRLAKKKKLPIYDLDLYPGDVFNMQLLKLLQETEAEAILSSTFRGIFRSEVISQVQGRAYNIHPTGIAVEYEKPFSGEVLDMVGIPQIVWPQPLFEGKQAFDLMFEMAEKFKSGNGSLDCQSMEWVIHGIEPPPNVDRGPFIGANFYPIPLPHEEQEGRDMRKRFNGAQSHCSGSIPEMLHWWGPYLFADGEPPWDDPRRNASLRRHVFRRA